METILTDTIKSSMRILSKSAVIEQDINNSIAACKLDLQLAGVVNINERLAHGGVLQNGAAMVAEAGPELIQMVNGQTIVTPLTPTARNTAMDTVNGKQGGSTTNEIQLKIENFYNNREQDIRELTEEILEIADQIKEREEAAYA